jgi:hypothetical protein
MNPELRMFIDSSTAPTAAVVVEDREAALPVSNLGTTGH